jgi:magnesium chelatase family protein
LDFDIHLSFGLCHLLFLLSITNTQNFFYKNQPIKLSKKALFTNNLLKSFMSSKILSATVLGVEAELLEVEADTGGGFGSIFIVGLPDTAVSEAKERVRSAIKNSNLDFPRYNTTINLAPAHIKKHGPSLDLPIAISVLLTANYLQQESLTGKLFIGELSLHGQIRPVDGILPIALKAKQAGIQTLIVPKQNAPEAAVIKDLEVTPADNLKQLIEHLNNQEKINPQPLVEFKASRPSSSFDMAYIRGQENAKRALEIAAAGGHNIAMSGPPGSGKTMLGRSFATILPDLTLEEALETTKVHSAAGELTDRKKGIVNQRPFRSPHHSASAVALTGGGSTPRPGEISLAHNGVLFLDEFIEFPKQVLESLRQPLEDGIINISRINKSFSFPARFILVASMNPCPCGYYGDDEKECTCSASQVANYQKRMSGPISDRIDIHIHVPRIKFEKLSSMEKTEDSDTIKQRVQTARTRQKERFIGETFSINSQMGSETTKKICRVNNESEQLLKNAVEKMSLSPRSYFRILKIARTIADLAGKTDIETAHVAEAIQYRP